MTLWDVLRAAVRRWPVLVAGLALTVGTMAFVHEDRSVYWTRTDLVFLAPTSTQFPNALRTTSADLIVTAGLIAKKMNGPARTLKFTSPDVGLIGDGVHDGWSVRLPDTGGQWAPNFADQILIVEVDGPDARTVAARRSRLVRRAQQILTGLQVERKVPPRSRISIVESPGHAITYRVGGSPPRALLMTGLLGVGTTVVLVLVVDARASTRRRATASQQPPERRYRVLRKDSPSMP